MAPAPIRSSARARTGSSTTAAWSSIARKAVAARSSSLASSTTTTRREPQASRSITSVPRLFIVLVRYQSSRAVKAEERRRNAGRASRGGRGSAGRNRKRRPTRARRRRTGGRADGRQAVDGRRHPAPRSADVHDRGRQHWCSAADVSRRTRLHGLRTFRWPR